MNVFILAFFILVMQSTSVIFMRLGVLYSQILRNNQINMFSILKI